LVILSGGNVIIGETTSSNGAKTLEFGSGTTPTTFPNPGFVSLIVSGVSEMFAFDRAGNLTQLSSHNPITGEWWNNSFNVYTGKGKRVYADGRVVEYTVDKVNPEEAYRAQWVKNYMDKSGTSVYVPEQEAFETVMKEIEVDSGLTKVETRWELTSDRELRKVARVKRIKVKKKVSKKVLKEGLMVEPDTGKIYKMIKPTKAEALLAAKKHFKFDWSGLPKFVRKAWGK
jgi:hypothetical protein